MIQIHSRITTVKKVNQVFSDIDSLNFGVSIAGVGTSYGKNLSRSSVLNQTVLLGYLSDLLAELSLHEIKTAFDLRIKKTKCKGKLPIGDSLLKTVYDISSGSFREILKIVYQLLVAYSNDPLVNTIENHHARNFFRENLSYEMDVLARKTTTFNIFMEIINSPSTNQNKLSKMLGKSQGLISRNCNNLVQSGLVHSEKDGQRTRYSPAAEYYIAFSDDLA